MNKTSVLLISFGFLKFKSNRFPLFLIYMMPFLVFSQKNDTSNIEVSAFVDAFYSFDFNKPESKRQDFFFNHNRHNEVNVNLGLISLSVNNARYRMNIGLQSGVYAQDNYAHEPEMLRGIYEGNVGLALNRKSNLWLDVGVFSSHIGFESAISIDNLTLTRSLVAENSPYYLSGANLTYQPNDRWKFLGVVSNGWQRIKRLDGNSMLSGGKQIYFTPSNSFSLNWSSFLTSDYPDSIRKYRYYNNFYSEIELNPKMNIIAGIDVGLEQREISSKEYNNWFVPTFIIQYKFTENLHLAYRTEYFQDDNRVVMPYSPDDLKYRTFGNSFNLDYKPYDNVALRFEARYLLADEAIFLKANESPTKENFFFVVSLAIQLDKVLISKS